MGKLVHFGNHADPPKPKPEPSQDDIPEAALLKAALDPKKYKHPSGIEAIQIIAYESFPRGEVIKLVMSAPYNKEQSELISILKAVTYLQMEVERLSKGEITIEISKHEDGDEDDE